MYHNLKTILNTKEKRLSLCNLLSIDNTRLSKKINGNYSKKDFTEKEKTIIYDYVTNKLNIDISFNQLFSWQEKELKLPNNYNDTIPKRIRICLDRIKYISSLNNENITENDIAKELNISLGTLRNYKNGNSDIGYTFINESLSKVLNVVPQYILGEYDIPMSWIYKGYVNSWNEQINKFGTMQQIVSQLILKKFIIQDKDDFNTFMNERFTDYYYNMELEIVSEYFDITEDEVNEKKYNTENHKEMDLYIYDAELDMLKNKLWLINNHYNDIDYGEHHYKWIVKRIDEIEKEIANLEKESVI